MIRINLLSEGRKPVAAKQRRLPTLSVAGFDMASLSLVALALLGLLASLGYNFLLSRSLQNKKVEVAEAQREVDELAPIIKEVQEFKEKRADLERKVQIIEDLKTNQLGPVRIMDYVSRALPELLWLRSMKVDGSTITIMGEAFNTNAVANFIENLDLVPEFQEPILKSTTESQSGGVYNFTIEFSYSMNPRASAGSEDLSASG